MANSQPAGAGVDPLLGAGAGGIPDLSMQGFAPTGTGGLNSLPPSPSFPTLGGGGNPLPNPQPQQSPMSSFLPMMLFMGRDINPMMLMMSGMFGGGMGGGGGGFMSNPFFAISMLNNM